MQFVVVQHVHTIRLKRVEFRSYLGCPITVQRILWLLVVMWRRLSSSCLSLHAAVCSGLPPPNDTRP